MTAGRPRARSLVRSFPRTYIPLKWKGRAHLWKRTLDTLLTQRGIQFRTRIATSFVKVDRQSWTGDLQSGAGYESNVFCFFIGWPTVVAVTSD